MYHLVDLALLVISYCRYVNCTLR